MRQTKVKLLRLRPGRGTGSWLSLMSLITQGRWEVWVFSTDVQASWKKICKPWIQNNPINQSDTYSISIPDTEDS